MNNNFVAENLRFLRKSNNLTQAQFAQKLHISPQAISKWEKDKSIPDIDLLMNIAMMFSIRVDDILNTKLSSNINFYLKQVSND